LDPEDLKQSAGHGGEIRDEAVALLQDADLVRVVTGNCPVDVDHLRESRNDRHDRTYPFAIAMFESKHSEVAS
jgi:hypothetical protein